MVGVPLSRGCLECIRLHVKCDEGKPFCFRCQMAKKECPGYNRPLKFVNVNPETQKADHQSTGRTAVEAATRSKSNTPKGSRRSSPSKRSANRSRAASDDTAGSLGHSPLARSPTSADYSTEQLFELFVDHIVPYDDKAHELQFMRKWLLMLPHSSQNELLQDAIRCLSAQYLAFKCKTDTAIRRSSECYGVALQSLQTAIVDPSSSGYCEVTSATMLLSLYEVFVCTNTDSWVQHAGGVGRLMQLQGPDAWDDFGCATFLRAVRFQLVLEAFMTKTPCFLAQTTWRERVSGLLGEMYATPLQRLADEYWEMMAELPGLTAETSFSDQHQTELTLQHAAYLETKLNAWFDHLQNATGIAADSTTFDSSYLASLYASYWAAKIIIRRLTGRENPIVEKRKEMSFYIEMICEIINGVEVKGVLEPYYLIFPVLTTRMVPLCPEWQWRIEQMQEKMSSMMEVHNVTHNGERKPCLFRQTSVSTDIVY